jgi:hypothetical protein
MHSKRGPLRSTPVSVVLPAGPVTVHWEAEDIREDSALSVPQVNTLGAGAFWLGASWPFAD